MRQSLPDDMQAAIEAALAEGRVTRVGVGVSGLPPLVWNGKLKRLVYAETVDATKARQRQWAHGGGVPGWRHALAKRKAEREADAPDRRAKIAALHAQYMSLTEICKAMKTSRQNAVKDLAALGLEPHDPGEVMRRRSLARAQALEADIRRLMACDMSQEAVAAELGVERKTLKAMIRRLGLKWGAPRTRRDALSRRVTND